MSLLEVDSGKQRPWLEHPTDSIINIGAVGRESTWAVIRVRGAGSRAGIRVYLVPWRPERVPLSEWIEVKVPVEYWNYAPAGNYFLLFQSSKLMAIHFDPAARTVSEPAEVKYLPGAEVTPRPDDAWSIRGPGVVFWRQATTSSVWLMKLPE